MSEKITLIDESGEKFEVKQDFRKLSTVVNDAIECAGENVPIPLNKISGATIRKIVEWTEHYDYNPPKVEEEEDKPIYPKTYVNKNKIIISDWDKEFLQKAGLKVALDLVMAANTLDYQIFYKVCIRYLALQIKGKKSAEVGELFKPAMQEFGYFLDDKKEEALSKKQKTDGDAVNA